MPAWRCSTARPPYCRPQLPCASRIAAPRPERLKVIPTGKSRVAGIGSREASEPASATGTGYGDNRTARVFPPVRLVDTPHRLLGTRLPSCLSPAATDCCWARLGQAAAKLRS
jgi:hypothetical protein